MAVWGAGGSYYIWHYNLWLFSQWMKSSRILKAAWYWLIIAVMKFKPENKTFRPEQNLNPCHLRYRCSTLPTELSSLLGPGRIVSSQYTRGNWRMQLNIWISYIYLNCGERYEDMIDHRSYEIKALKKNPGLNRIRSRDFCDTGAVLYQLSYQASWDLVTLWVLTIFSSARCGMQMNIYERSYISSFIYLLIFFIYSSCKQNFMTCVSPVSCVLFLYLWPVHVFIMTVRSTA